MTKVEPAISAEEWAKASGEADWECVAGIWLGLPHDRAPRHAIAAYALRGQEFGFTWEDVDELREAVTALGGYAAGIGLNVIARHVESVADRIEALLPPRETP